MSTLHETLALGQRRERNRRPERRKSYRQIVSPYTGGDEYAEALLPIELRMAELDPNIRGHYNLQEVFDRVNAFINEWSARLRRRG